MDQPLEESDQDQDKSQSEGSNKYKVVVNGEEMEVGLDELIGGYQRQSDYTHKTQELANQRKEYERMVEEKATELYLKALEEGGGKKSDENLSSEEKFQRELAALKEKLEHSEKRLEDREADEQLDKLLSAMRKEYPNMDEEKVLIRFHNEAGEGDNPEQVFRKLAEESNNHYQELQKKIIDDYIKRKAVNPFDAGEVGGSTSPATKTSKPPSTFEEARARAEARLRAMNG